MTQEQFDLLMSYIDARIRAMDRAADLADAVNAARKREELAKALITE